MFKRIKSWIGFSQLDPDVIKYLDKINARTGYLVSIVIMLLELFIFCLSFTFPVEEIHTAPIYTWMLFHRIAYATMFLAFLQLFLCSFFLTRWHIKHYALNLSIVVTLIVTILFSLYISYLDYLQNEQILVFVTLATLVSAAFFIKPYVAILLLTADFIAFYFLMSHSAPGISYATNVNYPVFYLLLVVINAVRYKHFVQIAQNAVENEKLTAKLKNISMYDTLTKAKNRYALREDFKQLFGKPILIMLTDIDNFKGFNDTYGHEKGDEILKSFSLLLQEIFGEQNCYRYGGDEFLVIIPYYNQGDFMKGIKMCTTAEKEFNFSGGYVLGVAENSEDLRLMIGQADKNLYEAKQKGKNCVVG